MEKKTSSKLMDAIAKAIATILTGRYGVEVRVIIKR